MKTFIWLSLLLGLTAAQAETISAQRIKAQTRVIDPIKMTVGPDDQFNGSLSPDGKILVFSHRADMVTRLQGQIRDTGEVFELLPSQADSHEAVFNNAGQLAFTYYRRNARGDICYIDAVDKKLSPRAEKDIHCLPRPQSEQGSERSSPFWKSEHEIGFLIRDVLTQNSKIVYQDTQTQGPTTLLEGRFAAPSMRSGGRYLSYSELDALGKKVLTIFDTQTQAKVTASWMLPGFSGFATFSADEKYLYWSHFPSDSAEVHSVDGRDNGVLYRISLDQVLQNQGKKALFPEQLTSSDGSCSYPSLWQDRVIATCALDGTLDVYDIPATGMVPTTWTTAELMNAEQTTRTYEERILLLNAQRFRFPNTIDADKYVVRMMSEHLQSDDADAARYYLETLIANPKYAAMKSAHQMLSVYLKAVELKKRQPSKEVTKSFLQALALLDNDLAKISGAARMRSLIEAHFKIFREQDESAKKILSGINMESPQAIRIESYVYFQLAKALYDANPSFSLLKRPYEHMMSSSQLSDESKVYYAFQATETLASLYPDVKTRKKELETWLSGKSVKDGPGLDLLRAEDLILGLAQTSDDKEKNKIYLQIDKVMLAAKSNYYLRKAMNVRAIVNFTQSGDLKYMSFIAANWLRDAGGPKDTEYAYSREVVSNVALDQGYGYWAQNKTDLASNYFYNAVTLTDDLESHAEYIKTMILRGQKKKVDEIYPYLKSHKLIDDNLLYVEALTNLIDNEAAGKRSTDEVSYLDESLKKLEAMSQDRDSEVRYLFMGYCYLEKMRKGMKNVSFDQELFQRAHRNLMLAYDQGHDNARVRAAALMNLGVLHLKVQNFGASSKFFSLRKNIGFINVAEQINWTWLYSKALYHTYQWDVAANEIETLSKKTPLPMSLKERWALLLSLSGRYAAASKLYQEVAATQGASDMNQARWLTMYGYSQLKQKNKSEAEATLNKALAHAEKLSKISKGDDRAFEFDPIRNKLIISGLLAQAASGANKDKYLALRAGWLEEGGKNIDEGQVLLIKTELQRAEVFKDSDPARCLQHLEAAIEKVQKWGDADGYLGVASFKTLEDTLYYLKKHPGLKVGNAKVLQETFDKTLKAIDDQKQKSDVLVKQRARLEELAKGQLALN